MKAFRKWDWLSEFHAKKLLSRVNLASIAIAVAVVVVGSCFPIVNVYILKLILDKTLAMTVSCSVA